MNASPIEWYTVPRERIPGILMGVEELSKVQAERVSMTLDGPALLFGFCEGYLVLVSTGPSGVAELFSWLSSFSPESFPISQYCRVVSRADLAQISSAPRSSIKAPINSALLSVMLGELLGQGDSKSLESLPTSRAPASFSFAVVRAAFLHGPESPAVQITAKRLRALQSDEKFVQRSVSVDELVKPWGMASIKTDGFVADNRTAIEVLQALERSQRISFPPLPIISLDIDSGILRSPSAERRVQAFEIILQKLAPLLSKDRTLKDYGLAAIAAAAFAVGRGTSHIDLLSAVAEDHPAVLAWFGLMAGLAGPTSWSGTWLRLVKSMERQLRMSFSFEDAAIADLCWPEYEWLSSTYGQNAFEGISKSTPRTLSVEIFPGATCQFRLKGNAGSVRETGKSERSASVAPPNVIVLSDSERQKLERKIDHIQALLQQIRSDVTKTVPATNGGSIEPPLREDTLAIGSDLPLFDDQERRPTKRTPTIKKSTVKRTR